MATQTRNNSFRARTRLKSAMSGASFRVLLWPHSTARNRSDLLTLLGTTHGNSHSSKPFCGLLETLFGLLSQNIGPDSSKPSPRDRKTLLRTAQNQLEATSGRLRDHFSRLRASRPQNSAQQHYSKPARGQLKAAPGSPGRKTPLRTAQNQLQASSRHRSAPLKTSSGPARDQLKHQRSSHQLELCMECTGHLCKRHRSPCNLQGRIPPRAQDHSAIPT